MTCSDNREWWVRLQYFNPLKTKRERVRKDSIRVKEKRKHQAESERRFISEGEKEHLLEGTQAMPTRPSDKGRMGVNEACYLRIQSVPQREHQTSPLHPSTF
jgi:hypothetical protein